jgi:chromosome segregation ATPase
MTTRTNTTTEGTTTQTQTLGTLAARRAHAQAALEAAEAQTRAARAQLEAQEAERQAAQARQAEEQAAREQAMLRTQELRARLDALCRPEEQERQPTFEEFCAARDRQEALMRQLRALADEPPPYVPMTRDEQRELLAELDAAVAASEHEGEGLFYHAGRLWDRSRFY